MFTHLHTSVLFHVANNLPTCLF